VSAGGNGGSPPAGCAAHLARTDQLHDDVRLLFGVTRDIDARTQAHDTALGQLAAEMASTRRAADRAADAAINTLTHVDQWRVAAAEAHQDLVARVRELEAPRAVLPSGLDYLSDDTKANAVDPGAVALLRELNAARERAAAAEAALATRDRISERAAAGEQTEAALELERLRIGNARWKILAGVAVAALTTLGTIVAALWAARGGG